jgi:fucose 4-O-acetylase-like acetyltransferase
LTAIDSLVGNRGYNYKIAYVRALGVIAVVLAHADLGGLYSLPIINDLFNFFPLRSFMIPVFFFVSGYLFEETPRIGEYIKKRFKRLVIPYYGWNLFYVIIFFAVSFVGLMRMSGTVDLYSFFVQPWVTGDQYVFNLATWFVLTLFLVQVLYLIIRKVLARLTPINEYFLFGFCLSLGLVGTYLARLGFTDSYFLVAVRLLFCLPFVSFGYLYKTKLEKVDNVTFVNIVGGRFCF